MTSERTTHEPFAEWAALAAVGALDGEERTGFDAHLASGCPECDQSVEALSETTAALAWTLPDVHPPPRLRQRVMARVAAESSGRVVFGEQATARARRPFWPWLGGLAAASVITALGWGLLDTRSTLEQQRALLGRLEQDLADQRALTGLVSGTDSSVAPLKGSGVAGRADGWVAWSPERKRGFLVVHNLPPLPAGHHYQLWVIAGQTTAPAGVFDVDAIGHASLMVPVEAAKPDLFAITVEPSGGRPSPSGPIVMKSSSS
jgi:anti-sigma-K factor RskA